MTIVKYHLYFTAKDLLLRLLVIITALCISTSSIAQWNQNSNINNLVAHTSAADLLLATVSDGNGGAIYFFAQNADNIYAQRISRVGSLQWAPANDPLIICNAVGNQGEVSAISDGAGGTFLAWSDQRHSSNAEIYIQHLNASGTASWAANGTRVTNTTSTHNYDPVLCSDGAGGVIVSWTWNNNSSDIQLSAQRLNSMGTAQWAANGVQLCTATGFRGGRAIVSDGSNGAIFFFLDTRNDANGTNYSYVMTNTLSNTDIYAQRISGAGTLLWTGNAAAVCTATGNQQINNITNAVSDSSGGAIVVYNDYRNDVPGTNGIPTNVDVYAQRLNNLGQSQWLANGVPVSDNNGNQFLQTLVADGQSGITACYNNQDNEQLLLQRINAAGAKIWAANGVAVSAAGQQPGGSAMLPDELGNYMVAYEAVASQDLRVQKISSTGVLLWNSNGIIVSNPPAFQPANIFMEHSGLGNAIISWYDRRNGLEYQEDIFASKILSGGVVSGPVPEYISAANGNWHVPATWLGGVAPPANAAVTIRHAVLVTANTNCFSIAVELPAGALTVQPGIQLTLNN